eukprot:scaffold116215_cov39-Phaeocystis_antarctica.AAC.1
MGSAWRLPPPVAPPSARSQVGRSSGSGLSGRRSSRLTGLSGRCSWSSPLRQPWSSHPSLVRPFTRQAATRGLPGRHRLEARAQGVPAGRLPPGCACPTCDATVSDGLRTGPEPEPN